jgi:hypothetical protein
MRALLLMPLLACLPGQKDSGIIVGNPPGTVVARVAKSAEVELYPTEIYVLNVSLVSCDGESTTREVDKIIPLSGSQSFEIPAGDWCALNVEIGDDFPLVGRASEVDFEIDLPLREIGFEGGLALSDEQGAFYIMELGQPDFLSADLGGLIPTDPEPKGDESALVLDAESCEGLEPCLALRDAIETGSAVFSDRDEDGDIDTEERDDDNVMQGSDRED